MTWLRKLLGGGPKEKETSVPEVSRVRLQTLQDRADVARMETQELIREWHDWARTETYQPLTREGLMRKEMVRSELAVRGADPTVKKERVFVKPDVAPIVLEVGASEPEAPLVKPHALLDDDLPEWHLFVEDSARLVGDLGEAVPARFRSRVLAEQRRSKRERAQ